MWQRKCSVKVKEERDPRELDSKILLGSVATHMFCVATLDLDWIPLEICLLQFFQLDYGLIITDLP